MNKLTFFITITILVIDQVLKSIVNIYVNLHESIKVIKDFFYITNLHNTGGAWSILANHNYIFIIFSVIAVLVIIKFSFSLKKNTRNIIAIAFLNAGILSNLADRLFLGYVRDYLDFKIFGYNYPVFNLADVAIVIGVILLIFAVIKGEDKNEVNK